MQIPDRASIRVETGDASSRPTAVLVLKYAQAPHGLDRVVLNRMGSARPTRMPAPGEHVVVLRPDGTTADALVLLGVLPLTRFGYREIREFGTRAVDTVLTELPEARELCLTLHGVNSGLDEREAFRAQVGGVLAALEAAPAGAQLRTVTFVERDARRARRLTSILEELKNPEEPHPSSALTASTLRPEAAARLRTAGLDSNGRPHAFVAMPFGDGFDDVFHYGIARPVEDAGLLCERMDRSVFTGDVVETMKRRIREARIVVADLSGGNPNVYLEIGFAWAATVPTVLLCDGDTEPHFDVRGHRYLRYHSIREAERHLARELPVLVPRAGHPR
jgi:hypothetical protein